MNIGEVEARRDARRSVACHTGLGQENGWSATRTWSPRSMATVHTASEPIVGMSTSTTKVVELRGSLSEPGRTSSVDPEETTNLLLSRTMTFGQLTILRYLRNQLDLLSEF